ncbi:MAG TPA: hypothetical protein VGM30_05990 [Puia sp.]
MDTTAPQTGGTLQLLLLLAFIVPAVLFMLTQQKTLQALRKPNRLMVPGLVWLQIIPLVGQIWQFFVVSLISGSIKKELASRQDDSILGFSDIAAVEEHGKRPTFTLGITYCILICIGFIIFLPNVPALISFIVELSSLSGMICWIVYWVQLAGYKRKLKRGIAG